MGKIEDGRNKGIVGSYIYKNKPIIEEGSRSDTENEMVIKRKTYKEIEKEEEEFDDKETLTKEQS